MDLLMHEYYLNTTLGLLTAIELGVSLREDTEYINLAVKNASLIVFS